MSSLKKILSFLWGYKVETFHSELNGRLEVWYRKGRFMLDSANTNYSFGSLHTIFRLIFFEVNPTPKNPDNALLLGLGGGSVVRILKNEWDLPVKITAVEHDPVIIEIAQKYFKVSQYEDTTIVQADAWDFVMGTQETYDMIVIDLFEDSNVPRKFHETEFLKRVEAILNPRGVLIYNFRVTKQPQKKNYKQVLWQINQQYGYTKEMPVMGNNLVIICRKF
jgi:spermidine synthase